MLVVDPCKWKNRQAVRADVSEAWSMRSQPFNRASIDPG